jgi:hypothetical protein
MNTARERERGGREGGRERETIQNVLKYFEELAAELLINPFCNAVIC